MTAPMYYTPSARPVSRLKERLSHSWPHAIGGATRQGSNRPPALMPARPVRFPASIAEFLLVLRLRARRPSSRSSDILERAVRVMQVTCEHWFGTSDLLRQRTPT